MKNFYEENCMILNRKFVFVFFIFAFILPFVYSKSIYGAEDVHSEKDAPKDKDVENCPLYLDFRNQKIEDIIYAIAEVCEESVLIDETVTGNATFRFEDKNFESALNRFAERFCLYVEKKDGVHFVSKVKIKTNDDGTFFINTENVFVESFLNLLSRYTNKTILFDSLPKINVTIRVTSATLEDVLNLTIVKLAGFALERIADGFYITKSSGNISKRNVDVFALSAADEKFSCKIQKASFTNVLDTLFAKGKKEYSLLFKPNIVLENLSYNEKTFEQLLYILLEQSNCDFSLENNIYYIYEIQKKDVLKKLKETKIIKLNNLTVENFLSLLPSELNSQSFIKLDKNSNSIILTGSNLEIKPIEEFIKKIDIEVESNIKVESVKLKYLKSDELLKSLPPSVVKENITETSEPTLVFFSGTQKQAEDFFQSLVAIDKPKEQIKYQLLVIQRQKTKGTNWKSFFAINENSKDGGYTFSGMLSNIFNINFDIISKFGIQFAGALNAELSLGTSCVLADTTLNGISGESLSFSNTNTYRYRDIIVDTAGDLYTSTTREITSGLTLSINGWASGDEMVMVKSMRRFQNRGVHNLVIHHHRGKMLTRRFHLRPLKKK
ncbi:MAG: type II and III secretion system protein [Treponema sp.]|nr:type II and III secretion system protein [Treponema sp.]